jgi:hypothetical protein
MEISYVTVSCLQKVCVLFMGMVMFCSFQQRIFLPNVELRRLIKRYASGNKVINGKRVEELSPDSKLSMMVMCSKHSLSLFNFLSYVSTESNVAPPAVHDLLMSLSSSSPVCSYLRVKQSVKTVIDAIASGVNVMDYPDILKTIREEIPFLFQLICSPAVSSIPPSLATLLLELWEKAEDMYNSSEIIDEHNEVTPDQLAFFPSLPKIRNRGLFEVDLAKKVNNTSCNKQYVGHPTLLPGIFTIYCQHGKTQQ